MPPRRNLQRNSRDVIIEEMQREIQQMQLRLARFEQPHRGERHSESEEGIDINPFSQENSDEEPPRRANQRTYFREGDDRRNLVRHQRLEQGYNRELGIKVDIPEFDGRLDPDEFWEWLLSVERVLDFKEIPPDRVVKLVALKLTRNASLWWENVKHMRQREGKEKIASWVKMKKYLQRKYLPDQYRQNLFLKLQQQQQQGGGQQHHALSNQQLNGLRPHFSQQKKISTGTTDGSISNSFRGNDLATKTQTGHKRKQPGSSFDPTNSSGTVNTAGPSPSSAPSTSSTQTPGDVMFMSLNKPLMMFGPDATGTLTSPSNQLPDEKVQADLDRFVQDGILDDNVESYLSHDDTDPKNAISRCKDVTEGFTFIKIVSTRASSNKIRNLVEAAEKEYEKEVLNERIAKLSGGVDAIQVGAQTETELKEKQLRVEDALNATKAAVEEGIVVGGGCTLLRLASKIDSIKETLENEEQKVGADIVKRALSYPIKLMANNVGVNGSVVFEKVLSNEKPKYGYNAATENYEDLIAAGIIDPTTVVVRCLVKHASSVARTFLTSEVVVVSEKLVWILLRKERFPHGSFSKLRSRTNGPFGITKKLGDIIYQIDLPGEFNSSNTFKMADLSPRYEDESLPTPGE